TAAATFTGTDSFQYTVNFALGGTSAPATVSVRVNRPAAANDWTDTDGTNPVRIDVLETDQDPDGKSHIDPPLATGPRVSVVSGTGVGTATLNADGTITYTGVAGFSGTVSFQYVVTDDHGGTSLPATVNVRINAPSAADDFEATTGTIPVAINVLENDT